MEKRYRLVLSAKHAYRDVELSEEKKSITVGTSVLSHVRFREQDFEEPFAFSLNWEGKRWVIRCSGNVCVMDERHQSLIQKEINPGERVTIIYGSSRKVTLTVYLNVDYDYRLKKYDKVISLENVKELRIGASSGCQVQLPSGGMEKGLLSIQRYSGKYILQSIGPAAGIRLNGLDFHGKTELGYLDFFSIGEYGFCFKDGQIYTDSESDICYSEVFVADDKESLSHHTYPKFNRSTRIEKIIPSEKIKILDPPMEPQKPQSNIVMQLLPAIIMIAVVVLIRGNMSQGSFAFILMSICTMGVGILTSVMSIVSERKKYKESVKKREEAYENYIKEKEQFIEASRKEEAEILENTYYSIPKELTIVDEFQPSLFERRVGEKDFLEVRLGTGSREAVRCVDYKLQERVEALDHLQQIPEQVAEKYKMLQDVPITMKLEDYNLIGVTGGREALYNVLKIFTMDLAVRHYYTDVKFVYSIDEKDSRKFKWLCLLPHVQNDTLNRRNLICDEESKNVLMEYLYKELSRRKKESALPRLIVFVYREQGIQTHPVSELMYSAKEKGITFIFFSEHPEHLPRGCDQIIQMEDLLHGKKINSKDGTEEESFVLPVLENRAMAHVARRLAPVYCEEISLESTLTKNISFFELLGIYKPQDRNLLHIWLNSKVYQSMAVPIGVKTNNQIIYLDINEKAHGPHGLVAGTTGSGKSEILQTYILSMSMHFHPHEVGFVLIDFKGGGMADQFSKLPHLIGAITNIDGESAGDREINRSLLSIRAELMKRQRIFKEYNRSHEEKINHIDDYIKLYRNGLVKEPLPHLILIVDEFAELKAEYPEFMKELISASRIGRSLGVHLILATQKPSGVVDPQIWSNSRFKLCLKVQSKEDSNEILKTPLAVEITEPGRAYLQVGNNEVFELFQSAYSGGSAQLEGLDSKNEFKISKVSLTGKRTPVYEKTLTEKRKDSEGKKDTQLGSVVEYISSYCAGYQISRLPYICQPPLKKMVFAESKVRCRNLTGGLIAYVGQYDAPERQYQGELELNVTTENTMIIGSAQNGKTNLLQMVIRSLTEQYSPTEVNLYICDFGSMILSHYEKLVHVGGVVCANEEEKFKNLIKLLSQEIDMRKRMLREVGVSSYASYLEAGLWGRKEIPQIPQIVVLIDNLTAMKELYLTENDYLLPLCREGLTAGVSFIIANSQTNGIGYKYLSNFGERLALSCNDSTEYNVLFDSCRMRPLAVAGRCLVEREKSICEAQTYLAFDGEKEKERVDKIKRFIQNQNAKWPDLYAKPIPVVPELLTAEQLKKQFQCSSTANKLALGLDYETVAPVSLPWNTQNIFAISGKAELGRVAFIRYMINTLKRVNAKVMILDDVTAELGFYRSCEAWDGVYSRMISDLGEMLEELKEALEERYEEMLDNADYDLSQQVPVVLLLNHKESAAVISSKKEILAVYEEILEKYKNLKGCILFTNLENKSLGYSPTGSMKAFKEKKNFLIFEEMPNVNLIDKTGNMNKKYAKTLENGDAYLVKDNVLMKVKTILE